jgi:hypothetical protein
MHGGEDLLYCDIWTRISIINLNIIISVIVFGQLSLANTYVIHLITGTQ